MATDKRAPAERRKPGRPRQIDAPPRPKPRPVRLDAADDDALCLLSIRHGLSIHAIMRIFIHRGIQAFRGESTDTSGL